MKAPNLYTAIQLAATVAALFHGMAVPSARASTVITDGNFATWSSFSFVVDDPFTAGPPPNVSHGTAIRVATGGTPGAFLQVTNTITSGDTLCSGAIKTDSVYNLAAQGAIASLSLSADMQQLGGGASGWFLVIEQSGQRYFSFPFGSDSSSAWVNVTAASLAVTAFDTNPWAGSGEAPDNVHPDFSATGAPLRFGFMFANRIIGSGTATSVPGLDNFSVTINQVPEPSCLTLMLAGLTFIAITRHRFLGTRDRNA